MKKLLSLKGIITVLNTPFTEDDSIDLMALCENVQFAMRAGVAGFLVPAMASEVDKLTLKERELIVEAVVETARGRVPVIGGASAGDMETCLDLVTSLQDAGCDGVLVQIPYSNDLQYSRAVGEICNRIHSGFLMLQDWAFNGYGLPVDLIKRLFEEHDAFRALKIEVVPAGVKYTEVLQATGGRLHVSGGWAVMQMIEGLDRGVHAFMPTGMHEIYVNIFKSYHAGNRAKAVKIFNELLPVLAFSNQHLDISIHFFKRLLYQQGIYNTPLVRKPILPFDDVHERIARSLIRRVQWLSHNMDYLDEPGGYRIEIT